MKLTQYFHDSSQTIEKLTAELTEEHAGLFLNDRVNNIKWHIGHIALTRIYFLERSNPKLDPSRFLTPSERSLFDRGGTPPRNPEAYPSLGRLQDVFRRVGETWLIHLEALTSDDLQKPHSRTSDETLEALLVFLLTHESYHCGQIGFIRSSSGYPSIFE